MSPFVQHLLAAIIVAGALAHVVLRFMPKVQRGRIAQAVGRYALKFGVSETQARRVEMKLSTAGACGKCEECRACSTPKVDVPPPSNIRTIEIRRA